MTGPYWVKPRLSLGLFTGVSHTHVVKAGVIRARWGEAANVDALFKNPPTEADIHLIARHTDDLCTAQEDVRQFLAQHADVPFSALLGNWGWDKTGEEPRFKDYADGNFVKNHTRSYLADVKADRLVLRVEAPQNPYKEPGLWNTLLADAQKSLNRCIHELYRTPVHLQSASVLKLPQRGPLNDSERRLIACVLQSSAVHNYQSQAAWQAFERLITTAFRGRSGITLARVFQSGSGAVTALFNVPDEAPAVVKVGTLLSVAQEIRGLTSAVSPKLHHFVSRSLLTRNSMNGLLVTYLHNQPGFIAPTDGAGETLALTALTTVAEPSAVSSKTETLDDKLRDCFSAHDVVKSDALIVELKKVLDKTVAALHTGAKVTDKAIWQSFGEQLPVAVDFELQPRKPVEGLGTATTLTYHRDGDERGLLAYDALAFRAALEDFAKGNPHAVTLTRMALHHVNANTARDGEIELCHPRLGVRLKLHAKGEQNAAHALQQQAWLRRGSYTDALALAQPSKTLAAREALLDELHDCAEITNAPFASQLFSYVPPKDICKPGAALAHGLLDISFKTATGAIHGDLNLGNILFTSADTPGWMIDFERSRADGPIAFDYAKLIVEMLLHYGIANLYEELTAHGKASGEPADTIVELLQRLFMPLLSNQADAFAHLRGSDMIVTGQALNRLLEMQPLTPLAAKLKLLADYSSAVFTAGLVQLQKARAGSKTAIRDASRDFARALAVYCFAAVKHVRRSQALDGSNRHSVAMVLVRLSEYFAHVGIVAKAAVPNPDDIERTGLDAVKHAPFKSHELADKLRAGLIAHKLGVAAFCEPAGTPLEAPAAFIALTELSGKNKRGKPIFEADTSKNYWDVASTGGLANITPIIGYLLLMARYADQKTPPAAPSIYVPKISSGGDTGGTVDTLEAGGYHFTSDADDIRDAVTNNGGLFCEQDDALTPIDKALMAERKQLGLMKSAELALASILGKKLALGATHVVIDVKLGQDSKMLPRLPQFMPESAQLAVNIARQALLIDAEGEQVEARKAQLQIAAEDAADLNTHLLNLLGTGGAEKPAVLNFASNGVQYLNVTLLYTNGDFPLCRAIGRYLILRQLNQMLGDAGKDCLTQQHCKFFFESLARACGWPSAVCADVKLRARAQWRVLLAQLPVAAKAFASSPDNSELSALDAYLSAIEAGSDVAAATTALANFGLHPLTLRFKDVLAWQGHATEVASIKSINVNPLEALFKALEDHEGNHKTDSGIGLWLHLLPGEVKDFTEDAAIISMFYRSAVPVAAIKRRLQDYLINHYVFEQKTTPTAAVAAVTAEVKAVNYE